MKIVRDYLTSSELGFIVNSMLEKDNALDREIVKVGLVAQLVAEDLGEFNDCNEVYDKVVADDTINFSAIINNYDVIDKIIAEELSINKIIKDFIVDINKRLDSIENVDLESAINQLKEISSSNDENTNTKVKKNGTTRKKSIS